MKPPFVAGSVSSHRFRISLSGDGQPGPIEERIGRRLVRLIDPQSKEGRWLIASVPIEWVGPDGASLGAIGVRAAYARLLRRLEARLESTSEQGARRRLQEGLDRLREWSDTLTE